MTNYKSTNFKMWTEIFSFLYTYYSNIPLLFFFSPLHLPIGVPWLTLRMLTFLLIVANVFGAFGSITTLFKSPSYVNFPYFSFLSTVVRVLSSYIDTMSPEV